MFNKPLSLPGLYFYALPCLLVCLFVCLFICMFLSIFGKCLYMNSNSIIRKLNSIRKAIKRDVKFWLQRLFNAIIPHEDLGRSASKNKFFDRVYRRVYTQYIYSLFYFFFHLNPNDSCISILIYKRQKF